MTLNLRRSACELRERRRGPWFVRFLYDEHAANLVAVSTRPEPSVSGDGSFGDGTVESFEIVAATLDQNPERYASVSDQRWDENAEFIAHSREDVTLLLGEIDRLRGLLSNK